jgi:ubiquitin-like-conjugating enzyme ATG3
MSGIKGSIEQGLVKAIGKLKSAPTVSQFLATGRLTPEEFVIAGDMLVYKCPAWRWGEADSKHAVAYLPPDKQYLIIRNAPCAARATDLEQSATKVKLTCLRRWLL